MKDGDKIRVKLPDGFELFQSGEVRPNPSLKSARPRSYVLKYNGAEVARLRDSVRSHARGVKGNVAYGGFSHSLETSFTVTDAAAVALVRSRWPGDHYRQRANLEGRSEGTGHAARLAVRVYLTALDAG